MAQQQSIHDGGSVIGYKPTLEYKKDRNSTEKQAELSAQDYLLQTSKIKYSQTLTGFINASPNVVLQSLSATSEYLQKLIEKLSAAFPDGTYQEYGSIQAFLTALMCGDDAFAMEFLNHHKHDIDGNQIPELIECIYCGQRRIDTISETVKQLYYGNANMSVLEAKELDEAYISQMRAYENASSAEKINYYALAVDTELDRLILMHSSGTRKSAMRISTITKGLDDSKAKATSIEFIKKLYSEVNSELDSRLQTFNTQQSIDIVEKALYNYYEKRQSVLEMYALLSDSQTSSLFYRKLEERQRDVQEALGNVGRSFRAYELYTSNFDELEREKHFLKDIYSSFNYISDE